MGGQIMNFVYQNAKGNITARRISNTSETDIHIQGLCHNVNELRTFRKDRILEVLCDEKELKERLIYHLQVNPAPKPSGEGVYTHDVCFTGFKTPDKNRLIKLANENDIVVRKSVTLGLNFLVCGYNAGPKKIEKARSQNVIALSEKEFTQLIETGEIPDQ
jgi:NAD-dependent DNA ligase